MFKSAKEIAFTGITVALLIGGQLVLSMVSGVEIVTALFVVYCIVFGPLRGIFVATAFSLVRCFVFGFMPQVIVLYLIYFNTFAILVGFIGQSIKDKSMPVKIVVATVLAVVLTLCFTAIDDILNICFFGLPKAVREIYILQSIPVAIRQAVTNGVIVPLLFYPFYKVFVMAKNNLNK